MNYTDTVKISTLPNGLTIITDEVPNAVTAYMSINLHSGSHHDPDDQLGLAHFAEHMAANAVPGYNATALLAKASDDAVVANMVTSPFHTEYFGDGLSNDVLSFMNLVAEGIRESDYGDEEFDHEKQRITTEMKVYSQDITWQKSNFFYQSIFGTQIESRWNGGTTQGFGNIKLCDIKEYHALAHTGSNMLITTSGNLRHDHVLEWADKNLGMLDQGSQYPRIASPLQVQDIWSPQPDATQLEFNIYFPVEAMTTEEHAQAAVVADTLNNLLTPQIMREFGVYAFSIELGSLKMGQNFLCIETKCDPYKATHIAKRAIELAEEFLQSGMEDCPRYQSRAIKNIETGHIKNTYNHVGRESIIFNNFRKYNNAYYDDLYYREIVNTTAFTKGQNILSNALQQRPATFYYGALIDDLPTGEMIQNREFDNRQSTQPVKRSYFDYSPFK